MRISYRQADFNQHLQEEMNRFKGVKVKLEFLNVAEYDGSKLMRSHWQIEPERHSVWFDDNGASQPIDMVLNNEEEDEFWNKLREGLYPDLEKFGFTWYMGKLVLNSNTAPNWQEVGYAISNGDAASYDSHPNGTANVYVPLETIIKKYGMNFY